MILSQCKDDFEPQKLMSIVQNCLLCNGTRKQSLIEARSQDFLWGEGGGGEYRQEPGPNNFKMFE